jgi:hypothetical protein
VGTPPTIVAAFQVDGTRFGGPPSLSESTFDAGARVEVGHRIIVTRVRGD